MKNSDHKQVFFWILSKGNHQLIEEILGSLIENLLTVYVLTANFLAPVFEIELMSVRSGVLKLSFLKVLKFDFQNSSQVDINIPFHTDWLSKSLKIFAVNLAILTLLSGKFLRKHSPIEQW